MWISRKNSRSLQVLEAVCWGRMATGIQCAASNGTATRPQSFRLECQMDFCTSARSGMTCEVSTVRLGEVLSTSFRPVSRVSLSLRRELRRAQTTRGTCGRLPLESFAKWCRDSYSWRTCPASCLGNIDISKRFSGTWPNSGMILSGESWELPTLAHRISAIGFGSPPPCGISSVPTPAAADSRNRGNPEDPVVKRRIAIGKQVNLSMVVSGPLNPEWIEWLMGFPIGWTDLRPLATPRLPTQWPPRKKRS